MSEKKYIHIRNWDKFQHRDTTRNQKSSAPWIKEYVGQLHDPDWMDLTFAQRGILHGLRLMYAASRGRGLIWTLSRTRLCTNKGESRHYLDNLRALNYAGFIYFSDSKTHADSAQSASPDVDTDVDGDREQEKNNPGLTVVNNDDWLDGPKTNGQGNQDTQQLLNTVAANMKGIA